LDVLHSSTLPLPVLASISSPSRYQHNYQPKPGRIAIVDHDTVELSNIQRQVLHNEETIGMSKVLSAAAAIKRINSTIRVEPINEAIDSSNAMTLLQPYDIILDCTDNVPTRYLLSDTAVRLGRPLVSGAAQKYEGQLCIYNLGDSGPCYRCIFPKPPAPEMSGSCEEMGILGAVTGVIGVMQALETIKILTGLHDGKATLVLFSALSMPPFRTIKLRERKPTCAACGVDGQRLGAIHETDYIAFCGGTRPDWEARGLVSGNPGDRISAQELRKRLESQEQCVLLDVRPKTEFGICHLPGSKSVPLPQLLADPPAYVSSNVTSKIMVLCRLGNDSQIAAEALRELNPLFDVRDVVGGLRAWAKHVDPQFPVY
jgi:adenylyltransferase/sulfurtransferase